MSFRTLAGALAAVTLAFSPVAVQAALVERATAPISEENNLEGNLLWVVLAIAAVVAAIIIFDGDDNPVSP